MTDPKVRIGVIGTGGMGSGHCKTMSQIPEAQLTAICDVDPKSRQEIAAACGVPAYENHEALLDSGLVDAVIIATPHYFHPPIAIDAFQRGIHVLSEKPIGVNVSAADAMIAAAKASGRKFAIMYQMRGEPQNLVAHALMQAGEIGEIYRTNLIMGWYRSQAYYDSGGWRATWGGEGGGVLINQAPHLLDLFSWLGGMPARLTAQTRTRLHNIEVEDEAVATLEYANGAQGYLYATTNEVPQTQVVEFCGDKGKLVLDNGNLRLYNVDGSIKQFTFENESMWAAPKAAERPLDIPALGEIRGHALITQNFCRAILHDEPLISPGEEGIHALELINGIILSGKTEQTVSIPVDRAAYDALLEELKATSRLKTSVREQRVTDPQHT